MMNTRKRLQRGQAAVELAVTMLAILPIIFYALFLADLTAYRIDQSEAIYSTSWDFAVYDYSKSNNYASNKPPEVTTATEANGQPKGGSGGIDRIARLTFCDHFSHYQTWKKKDANRADGSTFESGEECNSESHHRSSGVKGKGVNLAAHQCWVPADARQLMCDVVKDDYFGLSTGLLSMPAWNTVHNNGGTITCRARLGVLNYFMPQKLFQQFSKADLTTMERNKGTVHADAANATSQNAIILKEDRFGLLHDPWAVNWPKDMNGDDITVTDVRYPYDYKQGKDSGNLFYERMKMHYDPVGLGFGGLAMSQLGRKLVSKKLMSPAALLDVYFGDNPMTPTLAFKADKDRVVNKFRASAWGDKRQSDSYQARKDYYFGWTSKTKW